MDSEKVTIAITDPATADSVTISSWFLLQGTYSPYTWKYRVTTDTDDFKRHPDMLGLFQEVGAKIHGIW